MLTIFNGREIPLTVPLPVGGSGSHLIHGPWDPPVHVPNTISIKSAVFQPVMLYIVLWYGASLPQTQIAQNTRRSEPGSVSLVGGDAEH